MTPGEEHVARVTQAQGLLLDWFGRPFAWGEADCASLAHAAMTARGRETRLPAAPRYRSLSGARRALRTLGYANLEAALDGHGLERIPPAAALPGDLVALPGDGRMAALTVALGNGRVLGFHPHTGGAAVLAPTDFVAAWRT